MNSRLRTRLWTGLALFLGLGLRLWFVRYAQHISGDSLIYGNIARNWMLHHVYGYVEVEGHPLPTLIRLPGYPLFLAACFRLFGIAHYTAVAYVQAAVDLASCLLAAALSARLFGQRARLITLVLAALCPFTAAYTAAPLTETLTLFCVTATFHCLHRWHMAGANFNRWLWPLAAALAYSLLLRPEQALLAATVLPAMLFLSIREPRSSPLPVVAVALLILLPLIPWTIRNEHTFGVFEPLAPRYATNPGEFIPFGFQRWFRTWAIDYAATEDVYWNYDGAQIDLDDIAPRAFDSPAQLAETAALLADYNAITTATPELDARFGALAKVRIAASPLRYYIELPVARLTNMLLRPRTETLLTRLEWWRFREHPGESTFALASALLNAVYLVLALWGAILVHRARVNRPLLCAMLAFIVLRCALLLTLDNSEPRYTLEFFPIAFVLAAIPLVRKYFAAELPVNLPQIIGSSPESSRSA